MAHGAFRSPAAAAGPGLGNQGFEEFGDGLGRPRGSRLFRGGGGRFEGLGFHLQFRLHLLELEGFGGQGGVGRAGRGLGAVDAEGSAGLDAVEGGGPEAVLPLDEVVELHPELVADGQRVAEGEHEGRQILVAVGGVLHEGLGEDQLQVQVDAVGEGGSFVDDAVEGGAHAGALEGQAAREDLEGGDGEGVAVGGRRSVAAREELRRRVGGRAEDHAGLGEAAVSSAGDAEIHQLEAAVPAHQHVLGLHVPVDDARLRGGLEGGHGLHQEPQAHFRREAVAAQAREAGPVDELHGEEGPHGRIHPHVVDRDDVGVVQPRADLRLALEALHGGFLLVAPAPVAHGLDGHGALEEGVLGQVDHAHGAAAQHALDHVASDCMGVLGHGWERTRRPRGLGGRRPGGGEAPW